MLSISLRKCKLLFLLIGSFFVIDSRAQSPVCNLKFDVFELSDKQSIKIIGNIKAVLTDLKAKRTSEFSDAIKMPSFDNLTSGKYSIEVIKDGYQRRIKEFAFNCQTVNETLTVSKVLYLQKGDSKKVTKFNSTVYVLKDNGEQLKTSTKESAINNKTATPAKPEYPAAARAVRATGTVQVQVTIDVDGEVVEANAVSGHPLLRRAAEKSALESKFEPTLLKGQPVIITGIIVYNFIQ